MICSGLAGCGKAPKEAAKKNKPAEAPRVIQSSSGEVDVRGPAPKRETRWHIHWQELQVAAQGEKLTSGVMTGVTGFIMGAGNDRINFRANSARADRENNWLKLTGHVKATSTKQAESMVANELDYDAKSQVLTALGNVVFSGRVGWMGTFPKLMATSDFKQVGTPDVFNK